MDSSRLLLPFCFIVLCSGCSLTGPKQFWHQPGIAAWPLQGGSADLSPGWYLSELQLAQNGDSGGSPRATLHYLRVLEAIWPRLESAAATGTTDYPLWNQYHQCLARFLVCAQRHGHYIPGVGVVIDAGAESRTVPIRLVGSPWTPDDLQQIFPVGAYHAESLTRKVTQSGFGVPLAARRNCPTQQHPGDQFLLPGSACALTAVFRTGVSAAATADPAVSGSILEFYNPLIVKELQLAGTSRPLAYDLSAPFALQEVCGSEAVDPFEWFIHPETSSGQDGLFFLEPWQPGKIPVVMIHGLLSSPRTWVDMVNELRSLPGFSDHFQIWGFRYATGQPFTASAALLRSDLAVALSQLKQAAADPALDQIVLIGHSMGGLIAKAQVSSSGERMWSSIANRPLSQITADQATRERLGAGFCFSPQPSIRRVVFVAVPHGGSSLAARLVGQIGSSLVEPDPREKVWHRQLISHNPGVFSWEVRSRIPTSIDLLKPDSRILQTLYCLPVSSAVTMHSIIGNGRLSIGDGRGDGVVGINSARHPHVVSEFYVSASHTEIHRRRETVCEVWRILNEHRQHYLSEITGGNCRAQTPLVSICAELSLVTAADDRD